MRTETLFLAATFASLASLIACGDKDGDDTSTGDGGTEDGGTEDGGTEDGGTEDGGTMDGGTADGGGGDGGAEIDCETAVWDDLEGADRMTFMNDCVVPVMRPIFQTLDSERFADFNCTSCHGADLGGGTYAMPGAIMLDYPNSDSWPEGYAEYMGMQVMPAMAELLGTTIFNPETNPDGFQCNSCHK